MYCLYILFYVDDMIFTGNDSTTLCQLVSQLNSEFALKDLRKLYYFFGIKFKQTDQALHLSQSKYINDPLPCAYMSLVKALLSPMISSTGTSIFALHGDLISLMALSITPLLVFFITLRWLCLTLCSVLTECVSFCIIIYLTIGRRLNAFVFIFVVHFLTVF